MNQSCDNLAFFNADPQDFHARFVTVDESWVHHFTLESKISSMQWKHTDYPTPNKAQVVHSAAKVMSMVFWDSDEIILTDFLEKGRTVTGQYYCCFHCNNSSMWIRNRSPPPYSPDLARSDYHLFLNFKKKYIGGMRFAENDDVITAVEDQFCFPPKKRLFFQGISKRQHRWEKCVTLKGDYDKK